MERQLTLEERFEHQRELQRRLIPNFDSLSLEEKIALTKEFLLHGDAETGEVLDAVGRWKRIDYLPEEGTKAQITEELVDKDKFNINIALLWGITPDEFRIEWERKSIVVDQRVQQMDMDKEGKIAVIDIDGVLAGHLSHLISHYNWLFNEDIPVEEAYLSPLVGVDNYLKCRKSYVENGMFDRVPLFGYARAFLVRLREHGYKIYLITSRPYHEHKRIYADTLHWLRNKDLPFDALIVAEQKGKTIAKIGVKPTFFVEDELEHAEEIAKRHFRVFLLDKPYNPGGEDRPMIQRFSSLAQLVDILDSKEVEWELGEEKLKVGLTEENIRYKLGHSTQKIWRVARVLRMHPAQWFNSAVGYRVEWDAGHAGWALHAGLCKTYGLVEERPCSGRYVREYRWKLTMKDLDIVKREMKERGFDFHKAYYDRGKCNHCGTKLEKDDEAFFRRDVISTKGVGDYVVDETRLAIICPASAIDYVREGRW